jgi:hypothetical protein
MPSCFTHQTPPRVEGDDENVAAEEGLLTFSALKAVMLRLSIAIAMCGNAYSQRWVHDLKF